MCGVWVWECGYGSVGMGVWVWSVVWMRCEVWEWVGIEYVCVKCGCKSGWECRVECCVEWV